MFIDTIQSCLLPFWLAVDNQFGILSCQPVLFFLLSTLRLLSLVTSRDVTATFSVFISVFLLVSFVLMQVPVFHHSFCALSKISFAFFSRSTSQKLLIF